jgi:hypothetical protein
MLSGIRRPGLGSDGSSRSARSYALPASRYLSSVLDIKYRRNEFFVPTTASAPTLSAYAGIGGLTYGSGLQVTSNLPGVR